MEIENIKRVTLTDLESDELSEALYMIKKIAEEFDYDREDVFSSLLSNYDMNDGALDNKLEFY